MRIRALMIRILRQFVRDKRTLGLMIIAPIFLLWLMSLVFDGEEYKPEVAVVNVPSVLLEQLEKNNVNVQKLKLDEAEDAIENTEIDAYISMDGMTPNVVLEGGDPTVNKSVMVTLQKSLQGLQQHKINTNITYLNGSGEMNVFDHTGPVLIGFFIFFFVFIISGISFLRERTGGTLERLLATPLRRWEIVIGYVAGFGVFTTIQAILISWFSINVLNVYMVGSMALVLLITFLLAMTALTLGTFLSAFANNELQMMQFIPIAIVPQAFLGGLFNLDTVSPWLQWLGKLMPMTYGSNALRDIMIRGKAWDDISSDVFILVGFCLVFVTANILALRKHRKI